MNMNYDTSRCEYHYSKLICVVLGINLIQTRAVVVILVIMVFNKMFSANRLRHALFPLYRGGNISRGLLY